MSTSPRSLRSLLSFKYEVPENSTIKYGEYREEKEFDLHPADQDMSSIRARKGKNKDNKDTVKREPHIVAVNVASVAPFEEVDRSNTRAACGVYPKINEISQINMSSPSSTVDKIHKTPRQMRVLNLAIHRERLQKFDTGYLTKSLNWYEEGYADQEGYKDDDSY